MEALGELAGVGGPVLAVWAFAFLTGLANQKAITETPQPVVPSTIIVTQPEIQTTFHTIVENVPEDTADIWAWFFASLTFICFFFLIAVTFKLLSFNEDAWTFEWETQSQELETKLCDLTAAVANEERKFALLKSKILSEDHNGLDNVRQQVQSLRRKLKTAETEAATAKTVAENSHLEILSSMRITHARQISNLAELHRRALLSKDAEVHAAFTAGRAHDAVQHSEALSSMEREQKGRLAVLQHDLEKARDDSRSWNLQKKLVRKPFVQIAREKSLNDKLAQKDKELETQKIENSELRRRLNEAKENQVTSLAAGKKDDKELAAAHEEVDKLQREAKEYLSQRTLLVEANEKQKQELQATQALREEVSSLKRSNNDLEERANLNGVDAQQLEEAMEALQDEESAKASAEKRLEEFTKAKSNLDFQVS